MRFRLEDADALAAVVEPQWREHIERIAVALGTLRERLGGDEGYVVDDLGGAHPISLAHWREAPAETRLVASFSYQQPDVPKGMRATVYVHDVLARIRAPEVGERC